MSEIQSVIDVLFGYIFAVGANVFRLEAQLTQDFKNFILEHHAEHPQLGVHALDEATRLYQRYQRTGSERSLIDAIDIERSCLVAHPEGHRLHAWTCAALSASLRTLYGRTTDEALLHEVMTLARHAFSFCPPGHPERATMCAQLAIALVPHFELTFDHGILIEMIELWRETLSLVSRESHDFLRGSGNLAAMLFKRYEFTRDGDLLTEAIDVYQDCLPRWSPGSRDHGICVYNLASALRCRYIQSGRQSDLDEVIGLQMSASFTWPLDHPNGATMRIELANSLLLMYRRTGDQDLVTRSIELVKETCSTFSSGHPVYLTGCGMMFRIIQSAYQITGEVARLDDMQWLCNEGLSLVPQPNAKWEWKTKLAWLHLQTGYKSFNVAIAIQHLLDSLKIHPHSVLASTQTIMQLLDEVWGILDSQSPPLSIQLYTDSMDVYQRVVRLLTFLNSPALPLNTQLEILRDFSQLGSKAFVNAVFAESWHRGLEELELAHGLLWSQRLKYQDPDLRHVPESLATRLRSKLKSLALTSSTPMNEMNVGEGMTLGSTLTTRDMRHNHAEEVHALLLKIREIPGLERFMLGETAESLRSVSSTHPVVLLVSVRQKAYALILTPDPDQHALLPLEWNDSAFRKLSEITGSGPGSYRGSAHYLHDVNHNDVEDSSRAMSMKVGKSIASTPTTRRMRYLWEKLVRPVLERLGIKVQKGRARSRLHWCPTGSFSSLPIHAAGIYDGPPSSHIRCDDFVVSSYTPTLTSLLRVQRAACPIPKNKSCMVLVAEKKAQEAYLYEIPEVVPEIQIAAAIAHVHSVQTIRQITGSTTVLGTCTAIKTANIAHIACHGIQHPVQATESGFCLGNGRLTISQLMELKMDNAFLAFLSACETAKGDAKQPDQVMHLAAAMLFTGFKSVVATMWAISDSDGPMMAKWFYEELFASELIDADSVAYALDGAVGKLREAGVSLDR